MTGEGETPKKLRVLARLFTSVVSLEIHKIVFNNLPQLLVDLQSLLVAQQLVDLLETLLGVVSQ